MSFTSFGLHAKLYENIAASGYHQPTPIQSDAIPAVLKGRDVIGLAQTGTGKTAAFLLPVLEQILNSESQSGPQALVIAPTRELVDQIYQAARELSAGTNIRMVTIFGGAPMNVQLRNLRKGVDIIVACPGRLLDHLQRKTIDLSGLKTLVLDEADHMFDMGFLPVIRSITSYIPRQRQTLLFTATMPSEIKKFADELITDPVMIRVGQSSGLTKNVSHSVYSVGDGQKKRLLLNVVNNIGQGSAIIFTRTKRRAKGLDEFLKAAGTEVASLQGNLSQSKRKDAIEGFRTGKYKVLVATDIAARGIDVSRVSHVVNYDMPETVEAYTHRTGRTGRAERLGDAFSFATASDRQILSRIKTQLKVVLNVLPIPQNLPKAENIPNVAASDDQKPQRRHRSYRGEVNAKQGMRKNSRNRNRFKSSSRSSERRAHSH